ncbi:MAG: protein kinase, partial [Myxococcota bacterium]
MLNLQAGAIVDQRYVLDEPVAQGATGHVWKATDRFEAKSVAVKFLFAGHDPRVRLHSMLERETRALRRLEHPSIVRLVDANLNAVPPYVATEFVDGMTLGQLLG